MMELHICNKTGRMLKAFALGDVPEVIIGRDETCDVRILAKSVSREHCTIEKDGNDLYLRDMGSTGGTFLNGTRVERIRLEDGMEIKIGPAVLKFYDTGI